MRLAFAIAAHLETDILLVDEVLAVGDAGFQHRCLAKMEDVAGHGRTVLFVSHNLTAVQSLCKRVIYLSDGQTSGDGKPREQIQGYLSSILRQAKSKQLAAGKSLTIADVVLIPNPVESGNDLRFEFGVLASQPVRLNESAFVLYALEGPRVGVVDLRPAGFPFAMKAGDCLRIRGAIQSIPLVERQYRVSLWIDSGTFVGEVADVVDLIVSPATAGSRYTPARPEARGWVEFKSECTSRVESEFHLGIASAG